MSDLSASVYDSIEDANRNQWNNVVEQSSLGSVFHRYEWLRSVERGMDHGQKHVVVKKKDNPVGILPNTVRTLDGEVDSTAKLSSKLLPDAFSGGPISTNGLGGLPITVLTSMEPGFGGPVITTDESDCFDLMLQTLAESSGRLVLYHAIKAKELGYMRYGKLLAKRGYEPTLLDCRFELNLDYELEALLERMDKERRKALRDGRSNDYEVRELDLQDTLSGTYQRYRTDMERVDAVPFPRDFFEELATNMSDRLKVFAVEVEGTEAGRYVYLLDDEQSALHYYFSAIGDAANFEYHPTELLHAHAIEWGKARGYHYYDFGSSGSTFLDGTFRYKEKYGGRVVPTLRWVKGYSPVLWGAYRLGRRTYQRLLYDR